MALPAPVAPNVFSGLPFTIPSEYELTVLQAAGQYGIRPELLAAQIQAESGFKNLGPNSAGARGIAQFMPKTALGIGINPMDPTQAIYGAAKLDAAYIKKYGSEDLALAAYNAGEGAVEQYGNTVPPYPETQAYVKRILGWASGQNATGAGATTADPSATVAPAVAAPATTLSEALGKVKSGTAWQRLGKGTMGLLLAMVGVWFAFSKSTPGTVLKKAVKTTGPQAVPLRVLPK